MTESFKAALDEIMSRLAEGESLHRRMGGQLRKVGLRGPGRMHDALSCACCHYRGCLEKVLGDSCGYYPTIDMGPVEKAEIYEMAAASEYKGTFKPHKGMIDEMVAVLNTAINEARGENIAVYEKLCCLQDLYQYVGTKLEILWNRLDMAGWAGHDMGVCSMVLHAYYEDHPDGMSHDWNLG